MKIVLIGCTFSLFCLAIVFLLKERVYSPDSTVGIENADVEDVLSSNDHKTQLVTLNTTDTTNGETPFFIFVPYVDDPRERGHGTMHKVGVFESIAQSFPQLLPALPSLLDSNTDRDVFLIANGHSPKLAFRFWLIIVHNAYAGEDGNLRFETRGSTGSRVCGNFCDAKLNEKWKFVNNQIVLEQREWEFPGFSSHTAGSRDGSVPCEADISNME